MSIKGVDGAVGGLQWLAGLRTPQAKQQGVQQKVASEAAPAAVRSAGAERAQSAQAPEGVDPMLWSVLTTEERMFFSKFRSLGPLTYAPAARPNPESLPRGGRIDVTV